MSIKTAVLLGAAGGVLSSLSLLITSVERKHRNSVLKKKQKLEEAERGYRQAASAEERNSKDELRRSLVRQLQAEKRKYTGIDYSDYFFYIIPSDAPPQE